MKSQAIFPEQEGASGRGGLEARVASTVAREGLFDGAAFVAAVSGGPDSTALALTLKACMDRGILSGRMHVAHLNHQLRGKAAEADAAFVRRLARRLNASFHLGERDVRALARTRGTGIEEAARAARYEFLEQVAREVGATRVALGHTASDNVETVLQRVLRGTGLGGLAGIPLRRPIRPGATIEVVRPLLFTTRAEVLAYLRRRKVRCRQDATNVTEDYLRNRVRHELIPLLEKRYNRRVQEAVLRLAQIAGIEHGFVEDEAARRVRKAHPQWAQGALVAERVALQRMPDALLPVAMRQLIELAGAGLQPMTMEHYVRVARLVKSPRSGQEAQLPGGVSIHVGRDRLAIARRPARLRRVPAREVLLPVPGEARLPDGRTIRTEEAPGGARRLRRFLAAKTAFEEMLDADEVAPPLRVRGFVKGDRFRPLGSRGRKKLSDFFTDEGVPRGERGRIPVVCDRRGPIWIVGMRMDDRVKVTARTKRIVEISVE